MSTLYRTYRPNRFTDVVGQEHIVNALLNALKTDRLTHAFLFAGPRGTGKTTVARLLAKAANCEKRTAEGEPCNKCVQCVEIQAGNSVDVIEIDAASNRGIDEIRELRDRINISPVSGRYRVYIIDEVHMLTKEAFNAILKTLEEPPKHAIFILATTELHKVPDTILSRCQRYQFRLAHVDHLHQLLTDVASKENLKFKAEALEVIAKRAEGSFRDALSLLGNVANADQLESEATVRQLLGLPQSETIEQLTTAITTGDTPTIKELIVTWLSEGNDLIVLVRSVADSLKEKLVSSSDNLTKHAAIYEQILLLLARTRVSSDPDGLLLSGLVRIGGQIAKASPAVMEKNEAKEAAPIVVDVQKKEVPEAPNPVDALTAALKPAENDTEFWQSLTNGVKQHNHAMYAVIRTAQFQGRTNDKFVLTVPFRFYSERLLEQKNRTMIESIAQELNGGTPIRLECVVQVSEKSDVEEEDILSTVAEVFEVVEE